MIGPYIVLAFGVADLVAAEKAARLRRDLLLDKAWTPALEQPGVLVFRGGSSAISIRQLGYRRGLILGDLFDASGAPAPDELLTKCFVASPERALARQILVGYWGRYLAVLTRASGRPEAVLRDPSGALECFFWTLGGLVVVSSDPPDGLLGSLSQKPSIRWNVLADQLADPSLISVRSPLEGIDTVAPGALRYLQGPKGEEQLWRPAEVAAAPLVHEGAAEHGLTETIDRVVGALAGRRPILAEASGGLDSSIIAAALKSNNADVRAHVNFVSLEPGADERRYALALAAWLGVELTLAFKTIEPALPEAISFSQNGVLPSLNALDRQYDEQILGLAAAFGVQAVFTGFGGDAAFLQMADPAIFQDLVARVGPRAFFDPMLGQLARWTRRSAYSLAWRALRHDRSHRPYPSGGLDWRYGRRAATVHPWCADTNNLPPAKRLQITSLTHMLSGHGRSRRGQRYDIVHPHLTQPVLEQVLRTPADLLAAGGRDRGLVRRAFSGRLPPLILERRSKGDLGVLHAQNFVQGLTQIRAFLLDGLLVKEGLINPACLEIALGEAELAQNGGHLEILQAVATEGWARNWSARLNALAPHRP